MKLSQILANAAYKGGHSLAISFDFFRELDSQLTYKMAGGNLSGPMKLLGLDVRVSNDPRSCRCGAQPKEVAVGIWLEPNCHV